jgi:predicted alpha-1,2-mannosidase
MQGHESVSASLDYMYGDFAVSLVAEKAGEEDLATKLRKRSEGYKVLFDQKTGFIRALNSDKTRPEDFNPYAWGNEYCEGGAYQCAFSVPHDFPGLAALYGGNVKLCEFLDTFETLTPTSDCTFYGTEIHEASEMAANGFGQLSINNQPGFHIPYIFTALGYPHKTAELVSKITRRLFSSMPDGLPGDEDNGSLSAYYIFSALGFYPLCPATGEYVFGSPLFTKATIDLDNGKRFQIIADNNSDKNIFIKSVMLNGLEHKRLYLDHKDLIKGGSIKFQMSNVPFEKTYGPDELPFHLSENN